MFAILVKLAIASAVFGTKYVTLVAARIGIMTGASTALVYFPRVKNCSKNCNSGCADAKSTTLSGIVRIVLRI